MKHKYVIGVDFGTDSVRALLADAMDGREMDSEVSLYHRWNKGYYCDVRHSQFRHHPKDYLESLQEAISKLTFKHKELVPDIVALSLDTTASTPCLIDKKVLLYLYRINMLIIQMQCLFYGKTIRVRQRLMKSTICCKSVR